MTHGIHGEKRWYALLVLCLGVLMIVLDSTIVNVALPSIGTDLHFSETALVWVVNAYLLTFGGCLLLGGRLGDLYGQRRMFLAGLVLFTLASLACGVAQSQTMLIAARATQGFGGAIVSAVSLSLIMNLFTEPGERARAMGVYGFVCAGGGSIGVLLGGLLTSTLSWHWIFLVNLPIGILALIGSWRFIPESRPPRGQRIDVPGTVLLSLFLLMLVYPLTHGREAGWPLWMIACLVGALPMLAALLTVETRRLAGGLDPLLDVRLFRNPVVALGLALAFLFYMLAAFFLSYGIYLQGCLNWSPLASGLAILPLGIGFLASPLLMPRVVARFGAYRVLTLGFAMLAAGVATAAALAGERAPGPGFYAGIAAIGIGQGLVLPSVVRIVLAEVDAARAGVASGMVTAVLQIGAAVGAATLGGLFFARVGAHPAAADYVHGFRTAMFALTAVLVVCIALSAALGPMHRRMHGHANEVG